MGPARSHNLSLALYFGEESSGTMKVSSSKAESKVTSDPTLHVSVQTTDQMNATELDESSLKFPEESLNCI